MWHVHHPPPRDRGLGIFSPHPLSEFEKSAAVRGSALRATLFIHRVLWMKAYKFHEPLWLTAYISQWAVRLLVSTLIVHWASWTEVTACLYQRYGQTATLTVCTSQPLNLWSARKYAFIIFFIRGELILQVHEFDLKSPVQQSSIGRAETA